MAAIVSGQTPVLLDDSAAKIALHLVPLGAFDPAARYDVRVLAAERGLLQPIYRGGRRRYNFDGILDYGEHPQSTPKEPLTTGYVQVFRNGIIEYADSDFLRSREGELVIPSIAFEQHLLDAVARGFLIQEKLGIDPPIFVMLSLLGVSGYRLSYSAHLYREDEVTLIDRADLIVLEVLAERFPPQPPEVQRLMKPAFDAVWNAAGYEGSRNYDEEGNWSSRRM